MLAVIYCYVSGHQFSIVIQSDIDANLQPDIKAIKKRMEDLISRDYLERDKENPNTFRYLA